MTSYIKELKAREQIKNTRDMGVFGIAGGFFLAFMGTMKYLDSFGLEELIAKLVIILGIVLVIIGVICPDIISKPYQILLKITGWIGNTIFQFLLTVIFIVLVVPTSLFFKKKRQECYYEVWENEYKCDKVKSSFVEWKEDKLNNGTKKANSMLGIILNLIGMMILNKQALMIPVIVLLIILGLILFFASSTVLAPFIYTLF